MGPGSAPYGGAAVAYGTNPLSVGFPTGEQPNVLVDFATTGVAAGKIRVAQAKHEPLPPGLVADRDGNPSTNPDDYFSGGMLLPMGGLQTGHKGYGLAVAVELLGQAFTGSDAFARESGGSPVYGRSGSLIIALDEGLFRPAGDVEAAADSFVERLRAVRPAPGVAEVLVPGDPERRASETRRAAGIPVAESTWAAIVAAARGLGVKAE
jgi:LDH2 family malate/lactate/ureidoglycolate dehydrogenase